ncbi:MAG: UDP-N-acetylmuramate dehydrogenase [Candidatus Taylorbacteria bacterium]|nr:UDP-N-acetylmuramate dehydrogenase [Candidatus Taylorbacteria bacterium]
MKIETEVQLANMTTFKIGGKASYFALVKNIDELKEVILFAKEKSIPWAVLGGGSNILVSDDGFAGLVIKIEIKGLGFREEGSVVKIAVGAGENWDDLVAMCISRNLYGLENLSGIPGTVGATPVQNIGAYGVEVKDVIESVEVLNTESLETEIILQAKCNFEYRDSIFKKSEGKKYIITRVNFILSQKGIVHIDYKDIKNYFEIKKIAPTLSEVREAVLEIRKGKFPDLKVFGTAGSFFKNPIIKNTEYQSLLLKYPQMPSYKIDENFVKIPLAWVLDNVCNVKGVKNGNVGQYEKQALVLVNFGGASAAEVKKHAEEIVLCVKEKTGIVIELEVQYL